MYVATDWHLRDPHTVHLFISGRDKETSSSMSRSSTGSESIHLPSPENPTHLHPLTSSRTVQTCLPCVLPSRRPQKNSLALISPPKGHVPSEAITRSKSCLDLRRNSASVLLKQSFSLTDCHRKQKRQLVDLKNWILTPSVKTEESTQETVNPLKDCEVMFPSTQSSTMSHNAECSTLNRGTVHAIAPNQAKTTQSTHFQLPPTVPTERGNLPLLTPSLPNPPKEPLLTEDCLYNHTNHMLSKGTGGRSLSANFEALQLKRKRKKKTATDCVNTGPLLQEKL